MPDVSRTVRAVYHAASGHRLPARHAEACRTGVVAGPRLARHPRCVVRIGRKRLLLSHDPGTGTLAHTSVDGPAELSVKGTSGNCQKGDTGPTPEPSGYAADTARWTNRFPAVTASVIVWPRANAAVIVDAMVSPPPCVCRVSYRGPRSGSSVSGPTSRS